MTTTTNTTIALSPADAQVIDKQVADWRREAARLLDLIAHATGTTSSAALSPAKLDALEEIVKQDAYVTKKEKLALIAQARAAQPAAVGAELPPLPEPWIRNLDAPEGSCAHFAADQMHDYARAAIAADRAAQPQQAGAAATADPLREAVKAITQLLAAQEWADILTTDSDAVALWDAVNVLVERHNAAASPAQASAAQADELPRIIRAGLDMKRFIESHEEGADAEQARAAVPAGFKWPEPPAGGQSHVLFDDGYAEGWAKAIATVKAMLAATPTVPAQPVAAAADAGELDDDDDEMPLVLHGIPADCAGQVRVAAALCERNDYLTCASTLRAIADQMAAHSELATSAAAQPVAAAVDAGGLSAQPEPTVWYGPMPESNGRQNYTAVLHRKGAEGLDKFTDGFQFARGEYPDRVRYEADFMQWLIGAREAKPEVWDDCYDMDKHSGYKAAAQPVAKVGESADDARDPLYETAVRIVRVRNRASWSLVQRTLLTGFNRTGRLFDATEAAGVVSAADENGHRTVLPTTTGATDGAEGQS